MDIARERGDLTEAQIKEILDPVRMTEPVSPLAPSRNARGLKAEIRDS
jgi:hypothetical protein